MKRILPLALLLTACGEFPGLQFGQGPMGSMADPSAQYRTELQQAYSQLSTLSGEATYNELDPSSGQYSTSAAAFQTDVTKRWIRAHIDQSSKPHAQGADMLSLNDGKVTVKVTIAFFPITKTFPMTDPQVCSARGYTLNQTDFVAMVNEVLDPHSHLTYLGQQTVLGQTVDLLDASPSALPNCTHEHVGLDTTTHLPVTRQVFANGPTGEQDVFDAALSNAVLNPTLDPSTWQL